MSSGSSCRSRPLRRSSQATRALAGVLWLLAAAAVLAQPPPLHYELVPEHSFVHFEVLHFGTSTSRGRFGPLQGRVVLEPAAGRGEVGIEIATASVSTGLRVFDARLRQADLLAADDYPLAFFVARRFVFDAAGAPREVHGEITLRGVSQPLTLRALSFACRDEGGRPDALCAGDFEAELLRSDFGMHFGLPFVANRVRLVVQVLARQRAPGG